MGGPAERSNTQAAVASGAPPQRSRSRSGTPDSGTHSSDTSDRPLHERFASHIAARIPSPERVAAVEKFAKGTGINVVVTEKDRRKREKSLAARARHSDGGLLPLRSELRGESSVLNLKRRRTVKGDDSDDSGGVMRREAAAASVVVEPGASQQQFRRSGNRLVPGTSERSRLEAEEGVKERPPQ